MVNIETVQMEFSEYIKWMKYEKVVNAILKDAINAMYPKEKLDALKVTIAYVKDHIREMQNFYLQSLADEIGVQLEFNDEHK